MAKRKQKPTVTADDLVSEVVNDAALKNAKEASEYEGVNVTPLRDGLQVDVRKFEKIQTAAELLEAAGLDPLIWEPVEFVPKSWQVLVKLGNKDEGFRAEVHNLWGNAGKFRKRVTDSVERAADALAKRVFGGGLKIGAVRHRKARKDPHTLILGLVDHHVGKLCWAPETGSDYDLRIAEQLWYAAIEETLNDISSNVTEIILPVGNDFGHTDGKSLKTTAGTEQGGSHDGRYEKAAGVMESALIHAVRRCLEVAPVYCVHVPGNHDRITSYWLSRCIHWAFQKTKHVSVDVSPKLTKYVQRGRCLWGFAHGDGPKKQSLKDMMTVEVPEDWAKATECREWITGHVHHESKTEKVGTTEQAGLVYRTLPSLCATDAWHFSNGFSMARQATQSFLYSNEWGLVGTPTISARKLIEGLR